MSSTNISPLKQSVVASRIRGMSGNVSRHIGNGTTNGKLELFARPERDVLTQAKGREEEGGGGGFIR